MILSLIFILILIIGIILFTINDYIWKKHRETSELLIICGGVCTTIGAIVTIIIISYIIAVHTGTQQQITESKIKYESLCKRLEIVNSEYEDVSKSEVIKEIAEWNIDVSHQKYWAYNIWSNWFYNKEVVNSLEYIERSEYLEIKE